MKNVEQMLQFVASVIDGELFIYDDGFVIEVKNTSLWLKEEKGVKPWRHNPGADALEGVSGIKFLFSVEGECENVQYV